jgi:hypothetical protein
LGAWSNGFPYGVYRARNMIDIPQAGTEKCGDQSNERGR